MGVTKHCTIHTGPKYKSFWVRDGMPNSGMPNGENDVLRAECRMSLGAMPNGRNAEWAECRKLNSTKHNAARHIRSNNVRRHV